jgi:hypothetical protein
LIIGNLFIINSWETDLQRVGLILAVPDLTLVTLISGTVLFVVIGSVVGVGVAVASVAVDVDVQVLAFSFRQLVAGGEAPFFVQFLKGGDDSGFKHSLRQ